MAAGKRDLIYLFAVLVTVFLSACSDEPTISETKDAYQIPLNTHLTIINQTDLSSSSNNPGDSFQGTIKHPNNFSVSRKL